MAKIKTKLDIAEVDIDEATGVATKQLTKTDIRALVLNADAKIQAIDARLTTLANERAELIDQSENITARRAVLVRTLDKAPD